MGCTSTKLHDIKSGVRGGRKCEKPPASNQSPSGPQAGQSPQHKSKGPVLNEEDLVAAAPTATTTSSSGTTMRTSSPTSGPKGPGSPHGRAGSPGRGALPEPERSDSGAVRHDDVNFSSPMSPVRQHYLSPVQTPPDSPRDQRPRALSTCVPARGTCRAADGGDMLSFLSSAPNFHESSYFRMYHFTSKDAGDLRAFSDPQIAERLPEWERYTARYLEGSPHFDIPVKRMWTTMLNFEFREAIESKRPVTDLCDRSALASSNVSMIQTWDSTAKATWFYTTNACYRQLNEAIVADKEAALWPYMRLIRNINSYLVNHPPQSDITTMRGTWMSPDTFQSFRRGNTYRLSQYVSTSAKESVAADFKGTCLLLFNIPRGCFNGASIAAVSEYGEDEAEYLLPPYTLVQCIRVDRGAKTISFDVMVDNRDWELRHECLGGAQHGPTTPKNVPYTWHVTAAEILDGFQALDGVIQASVWIKFWQEGAKKYEDVPSQAMHFFSLEIPEGYYDGEQPWRVLNRAMQQQNERVLKALAPWREGIRLYFCMHPLSYEDKISAYRGTNKDLSHKYREGKEIVFPDFSFASLSAERAQRFASSGEFPCEGTFFEFRIPPGCMNVTNAALVADNPEAQEVIFFANARLKVAKVERDESGMTNVVMDVTNYVNPTVASSSGA